jgi:membrane protein implicated in regulation of membrane protease activity
MGATEVRQKEASGKFMAQLSCAALVGLGTMKVYQKMFTLKARKMDNPTLWMLIAGGLVIAELMTGTFYLLMLSLGAAAAALTAYAGGALTWQIVTAAFVGGAAAVLWHMKKSLNTEALDSNVPLDIGETVTVDAWDAQGHTQVKYRGAQWAAVCSSNAALETGLHRISEMHGNRLVLEKI